jgi:Leucine-rich repeat (LRR) protein
MSWSEIQTWLTEQKVIDESVTAPEMIKRLDLSGHGLSELPESFGVLSELIALNLSNNALVTLPGSMENLTKLTNLDLRRNHLGKVPEVLTKLSLRSLNLSGNMLDDVSNLDACKELRVLDLSVNAITAMGDVFSVENEIRTLNLSHNYIKNVTKLLSSLPNTERLDLSGNLINHIPQSIGAMESLVELKLGDNVIEFLDDKLFGLGLETLDLSSNKLYWIRLEGLQELENIILDFNPIKHIEVSETFAPYLEEFSCDGCGLKSFVPIGSQELNVLCYSSNEITKVPEYLGGYVKLQELDLDGNDIVELPDSMANLTALDTLYIEGNPLSDAAKKIIEILHPEICDIHMKRGITIENAQREDLEAMAHLLSILFAIEQDFEIDFDKQLAGITKLYESQGKELLVAKYEGEVVGMVTMQRLISSAEGDYIGQIEDLVVKEDYRKMGVGSRLLNKMRAIAEEYGYKRIQLAADEANANAQRFYTRRGFHQTHLKIYHYNA